VDAIKKTILKLAADMRVADRRIYDLRPEDGPSIWPALKDAAGGDHYLAVRTMHKLDRMNIGLGRNMLVWARRGSQLGISETLYAFGESLCDCGVEIDGENEVACPACLAEADAIAHADALADGEVR
jgi:hypothetical protein